MSGMGLPGGAVKLWDPWAMGPAGKPAYHNREIRQGVSRLEKWTFSRRCKRLASDAGWRPLVPGRQTPESDGAPRC